ncbi:tetratricopeptide repeat protein [Actinoplanes sp. LDG1-06]|uniref:Tetratricopeptide repeat protein n=1 Tax=Paractinoplanes ovalisporus TaxID=2810368 RepID=A0ABS2ADK0_9ACTN|nr:FxSxx-COOH system tetratricopeptide repeat protein [Actinoplanes ovalisporus]MBM2617894.1 tetratricopeptide repeat protein [Actinoplanes ovalisporus]
MPFSLPTSTVRPALPAPSATVAFRVHGELPARSPFFTGREHVLDEIEARLRRSPETPLVLFGPIGSGKTQLAAEYVRQHAGDYAITWWVRADNVELALESLFRLARDLGLVAVDGQQALEELFALLARSGPYLLVFDGVISGDIQRLIRMRGGTVVVTTRNATWAQESRHDRFEVPDLDEAEAAQLLRKQDAQLTPEQIVRVSSVAGRSPLGLAEVARLREEGAATWEDLAGRLADPVEHMLTGPGAESSGVAAEMQSIVRGLLSAEPELLPLLTLLLGFGPSRVPLWMLRAGVRGELSANARSALGDVAVLRGQLQALTRIGLARGPADGEWIEMPAIVRLVLRERVRTAWGEINRRDVADILTLADPAHPEEPATADRHAAIAPHVRPADLIRFFRRPVYRTLHHQIRFLFRSGDLGAAQRLGNDVMAALRDQDQLAPTDELVLQIRRDLANALRADGRYAEAERLTGESMELIEDDPSHLPGHVITLDLARSRGHDLRIAGRYREAYELDRSTHARHVNAFGADDQRRLASRYNLSVSRRFLGLFEEAEADDREDLDALPADRAGDDRHRLRLTNALAEDLYGLGRHEEVGNLLAPLTTGERGRELVRARRMTAVAFRRLGRLAPAVDQLGACYQACLHQEGPRRELTLAVGMSYGNALRALGQHETALHYCRQAAEGYAAAMGERNPLVSVARVNTAAVLLAQGRAAEAVTVLDEAYDALTGQLGEQHPFTVVAAVNRAAATAMTDPAEARSWSSRAYTLAWKVFGPDHLDTLLAAAGFAADRAVRDEGDGPAPSLDHILAVLRRRFGAGHTLVSQVAGGVRVLLDVEVPSA